MILCTILQIKYIDVYKFLRPPETMWALLLAELTYCIDHITFVA